MPKNILVLLALILIAAVYSCTGPVTAPSNDAVIIKDNFVSDTTLKTGVGIMECGHMDNSTQVYFKIYAGKDCSSASVNIFVFVSNNGKMKQVERLSYCPKPGGITTYTITSKTNRSFLLTIGDGNGHLFKAIENT